MTFAAARFAADLNGWLARKKWNQIDLARHIGCGQSSISRFCLGRGNSRSGVVEQIARVAGMDLEDYDTSDGSGGEDTMKRNGSDAIR